MRDEVYELRKLDVLYFPNSLSGLYNRSSFCITYKAIDKTDKHLKDNKGVFGIVSSSTSYHVKANKSFPLSSFTRIIPYLTYNFHL